MPNDQKTAPHEQERQLKAMKTIEYLAYPLALIAGYKSFNTLVRRGIYKNVARTGMLDELQTEHLANKIEILKHDVQGMSKSVAMAGENNRYRIAVKNKFNEMGFSNIVHFWRGAHPNQRAEAFEHGATITGIAIGAILLLTQNRALNAEISERIQERKEKEEARGR